MKTHRKTNSLYILFLMIFTLMGSVLFADVSNTPVVSISPVTQNAVLGTENVQLDISLDVCPNNGDIEVTYSYGSESETITFIEDDCTETVSLTIELPSSLVAGDNYIVTITASSTSAAQNDPTIAVGEGTATISIIAPPSNTPTISISPDKKNIRYDDTSVPLSIMITECPNKEDIIVTYTYVDENNLTTNEDINFTKDDIYGDPTCTLTWPITVDVPPGLVTNDKFDVNITNLTSNGYDIDISTGTTGGEQKIASVNPVTSVITLLASLSDLYITKTALPTVVVKGGTFQYFIDVSNNGPDESNATRVVDQLPSGMDIDITSTNSDNTSWDCNESTTTEGLVTCTHTSGGVPLGQTHVLILNVTAPSITGYITNTADVFSDNDGNELNNEGSVTITVVDASRPTALCYYDSLDLTPQCLPSTPFFFGNQCDTSVSIGRYNTSDTLTEVNITKLYSPIVGNGTSSYTFNGTTNVAVRDDDLSILDYTPYHSGYIYPIGVMSGVEGNLTISDSDTYQSEDNQSLLSFTSIILHATYVKDGITYAGRLNGCPGGGDAFSNLLEYAVQVDVVDDDYDFSLSPYAPSIKTKVSGKDPYVMKAVYLGAYDDPNPTPQEYPGGNNGASITVLFKLVDMDQVDEAAGETCESATGYQLLAPDGTQLMTTIDPYNPPTPAETWSESQAFTMAYKPNDVNILESRRNMKFQYKAVDFNQLIDDSGINCVQRSSTGGVVEGIPACMIVNTNETSDNINTAIANYIAVFGTDAYNDCYAANGQPCYASNGGVGADPYDTDLGCFECSIQAFPSVCSLDNFAIRPEKFDVNSTNTSYPDLMRAGAEYDLSINAVNYGTTTNSVGYNQAGNNIDESNVTKYWANDTTVANASMTDGNATLGDFNMTNGQAIVGGAISTVTYKYTEVGDIQISIVDNDWSAVDILHGDTPADCSPDGASICSYSDATFIPDHFDLIVDLNNSSNAFTYLSNDVNMTANLSVAIYAMNALGNITKYFTEPTLGHTYYENPMTVKMIVPGHAPLVLEKNEVDPAFLLGFSQGSRTLTTDEVNASLSFWFHYVRETNVPVNPFRLYGSDVIIDVNSTYPATGIAVADEGTADIIGTDSDDANITYVYGRAHMARTRAMCGIGSDCNAYPIFYYEFYGNKEVNQTLITQLLDPLTPQRSIDSVNWYKNTKHAPANDGNVTASNAINDVTASYATDTPPNDSRTKGTFVYDTDRGYPYKVTVEVNEDTNQTQSWLIYDRYKADATQVTGQLEFYGPGKWSSTTSGADTSIDDNASSGNIRKNTNRRIRW